jgi:hypothetical protein
VQLEFSAGQIKRCIYINNMAHEKSEMPKDPGPDGKASFRVLYDGVVGKLFVFRNGKQVGDWKLREEKDAAAAQRAGSQRNINGICLERSGGPRIGRLRIQPWDGALPKEGEPPRVQDLLTLGKNPPTTGKLESIAEKDLQFSGEKKPRGAGVFLQLHSDPKPMTGADALLLFGVKGELGAAELEIQGGRASFRTSFADRIEVPISALKVVAFVAAAAKRAESGTLVFKNGDELPGSLVRAESGTPLKWKTPGGQDLEFQSERVAGVRFVPRNVNSTDGATIELRNGDRLRGEFAALNPKELQFKHPLLGALSIGREQLWTLFPNPKTTLLDAANHPSAWEANGPQVQLDGRFAIRQAAENYGFTRDGRPGIGRELRGLPDKFELRCEALDVSGNEPNLSIRLTSEQKNNSNSSLDLDFNYGSLRLYGWVSGKRSQSFWKDVALRNRNGRYEPVPRVSVRLFVDNKLGTVDVFVNGVHRVKSGQNAKERVPGVAGRVHIGGYGHNMVPVVISEVWAGPWNGELPRPDAVALVALSNGDVAEAVPTGLRNGKLLVDAGSGEMEVPLDRVDVIGFGGTPEPKAAPGRLRLFTGDAVSVESFKFEAGQLTARSPVFGEIRLPGEALRELVFDAAPARFPMVLDTKKKLVVDEAKLVPGLEQRLPR